MKYNQKSDPSEKIQIRKEKIRLAAIFGTPVVALGVTLNSFSGGEEAFQRNVNLMKDAGYTNIQTFDNARTYYATEDRGKASIAAGYCPGDFSSAFENSAVKLFVATSPEGESVSGAMCGKTFWQGIATNFYIPDEERDNVPDDWQTKGNRNYDHIVRVIDFD